jgi:hypothetical protein
MIERETITLPTCWASALVNGDFTGLDHDEEDALLDCLEDLRVGGWSIVSVVGDEPPYCTKFYRMYGGTADYGEVVDYVMLRAVADVAI